MPFQFKKKHVLEAIKRADKESKTWLGETYPEASKTRFVKFKGKDYDIKPLGRLASEIAGQEIEINYNPDVFARYFNELGFETVNYFNCDKDFYNRQKKLIEVLSRPNQAKFRTGVLANFDGRCLISGLSTRNALQAAHIIPVAEGGSDETHNGIPLRADIHLLFDAGHISIDPDTLTVNVDGSIKDDYKEFDGLDVSEEISDTGQEEQFRDAFKKRAEIGNS